MSRGIGQVASLVRRGWEEEVWMWKDMTVLQLWDSVSLKKLFACITLVLTEDYWYHCAVLVTWISVL